MADSLDKNGTVGGELRYKHYIPLVQSTYGGFETECTNAQASTETQAAGLSGAARITYLTNYYDAAREPGAEPGRGAAGADAVTEATRGGGGVAAPAPSAP